MIKAASNVYKMENIPPPLKLRRSSGNKNLENYYISKQNIKEYNLYRKQEIIFISEFINFYKHKNIIINILNKKCNVYNNETAYDVLDIYLMPIIKHYDIKISKIVKYSLDLNNNHELKQFISNRMDNLGWTCMAVELGYDLEYSGLWFKYRNNNNEILVNLNYLWNFIDDIYLTF